MTRLPDWEARLSAYLDAARDRPFAFGVHDCALHAASAAFAVTGIDPGAVFRGRYTTARGAARALRKWGAGTLTATFDALYPVIAPSFAGRGDLVTAGGFVGVCIGPVALFAGEQGGADGLVRVPRAEWTRAWGVGLPVVARVALGVHGETPAAGGNGEAGDRGEKFGDDRR